ncbi:hypothetical protein MLD38_006950 [Melastoma candidum]|uniref:Uncharacterized protein n=1 Tax=Melastoma candidum TaxID=119954 RepID=A0ACB9RP94_9MYRT|nr:hypothetical protein MLD38_006950 [Melastoma candidum]
MAAVMEEPNVESTAAEDCDDSSDVETAVPNPPEVILDRDDETLEEEEEDGDQEDDRSSGTSSKPPEEHPDGEVPENEESIIPMDDPELDAFQVDEKRYRPLVLAAYTGDWKAAARFFARDPDARMAKITTNSETALHIATMTGHDQFVEKLVEVMDASSLAMADTPKSRTALHYAAMGERIRMIKALVRKNPSLTQLPDKSGSTPLHLLSKTAPKDKDVLLYLAQATNNDEPGCPFSGPSGVSLVCGLTDCGFQDVVLYVVDRYPHLLMVKTEDKETVVSLLARDPSNFLSGSCLNSFERFICRWIPRDMVNTLPIDPHDIRTDSEMARAWLKLKIGIWNAAQTIVPRIRTIREAKLKHECSTELVKRTCEAVAHMKINEVFNFFLEDDTIIEATNKGIVDLVEICLMYYPELIWSTRDGTNILSSAIEYRQEKVFRLLSKRNALNKRAFLYQSAAENENEDKEESREYLLRSVAKLSSNFKSLSVSGAAFQMQTEVQWFKAVEQFVDYRDTALLRDNKTSWVDFKVSHDDMRKNGEQWMKDTSNSCMLVAALIATVVFAAAFTVPGGNIDGAGIPLFLNRGSFMVFAVSTALALFSSVTAILMFLAILTSRYDPIDFLKSLPQKVIIGLASLFLSLAFMMVSFGATLTLLLDRRIHWIIGPVILMACIPIAMFATLQLPLFVEMVKSTYRPKIFHGKRFWK